MSKKQKKDLIWKSEQKLNINFQIGKIFIELCQNIFIYFFLWDSFFYLTMPTRHSFNPNTGFYVI